MKTVMIIVCCLLISPGIFAQGMLKKDTLALQQPMYTFTTPATNENKTGQLIPQNLYTQSFGFFCRQELKMEQAHIPVSFRLGSMDDCNWLEQKPGYETRKP